MTKGKQDADDAILAFNVKMTFHKRPDRHLKLAITALQEMLDTRKVTRAQMRVMRLATKETSKA